MNKTNKPLLTPELAGEITKLTWEFQAINRKRQLVDDLMALGVTQDVFREWTKLVEEAGQSLSIPRGLNVDIQNLLSSIPKGRTVRVDELVQISPRIIADRVKKTMLAQARVLRDQYADEPDDSPADAPGDGMKG
jgi:hypothetical protein